MEETKDFIKQIFNRNRILATLGSLHLALAILMLLYAPFNTIEVLGINAVIKPIKFALSIAVYSYTMAWILYYLKSQNKVYIYSWVAVIAMCFEQLVITFQALRGQQSHFNYSSLFNGMLYALMGVFILILTLWTAYMTLLFLRQKVFSIKKQHILAIRIGLVYFVIFSLFGGYIAQLPGHTVGSKDGGAGLPFLNWSTLFGDLRVAHFFGMHALQLIPLLSLLFANYFTETTSIKLIRIASIIYLLFVLWVMLQALLAKPFIK